MGDTVPSIYGPGAIICWLCTSFSVVLSWKFNIARRKYDFITSDFLACLLLPTVAICHLIYTLCRTGKYKDDKTIQTMQAEITVCSVFAYFGIRLCLEALFRRHKRKLILTIIATTACLIAPVFGSVADIPSVHCQSRLPFFTMIFSALYPTCSMVFTMFRNPLQDKATEMSLLLEVGTIVSAGLNMAFQLVLGVVAEQRDKDQLCPNTPNTTFPKTPYSIGELDQAIALGVGIYTLLVSIRDVSQYIKSSNQDTFEHWRASCIENIEAGKTEVEIARWKRDLDLLGIRAKCHRTRAKHGQRERERWSKLPKEVLFAFKAYRDRKNFVTYWV